MDFSPIYQVLLSLWYLLPLLLLAALIKSAWLKGLAGEFIVNSFARWKLDKSVYHLIKNVTLPTEDGTTQIDHIIVSIYGVFVVETKNLKGWIFGGEKQKVWTQKIYKHNHKFQNPLHQNLKHSKTLKALLNLEDHQLHSVVVFIGNSTFKTVMPENVTYGMSYIRYIQSHTEPVLSPEQVAAITQTIEAGRLARTFNTHRQHARHVQRIIAEKEQTQRCPTCGSQMVLRESKKGSHAGQRFWGCSTFPKCRAAKPVV